MNCCSMLARLPGLVSGCFVAGIARAGDEGAVALAEPSVLGLVAAGVVVSVLVFRGRR